MLRYSKRIQKDKLVKKIQQALNHSWNRVLGYLLAEMLGIRSIIDISKQDITVEEKVVTKKAQEFAEKENTRRNKPRLNNFKYESDMLVLQQKIAPNKLSARYSKPKKLIKVHKNDNVVLIYSGLKHERVNIKRLKPFHNKRGAEQNDIHTFCFEREMIV